MVSVIINHAKHVTMVVINQAIGGVVSTTIYIIINRIIINRPWGMVCRLACPDTLGFPIAVCMVPWGEILARRSSREECGGLP